MATGPRYSVKFRRRKEGKTDYKRRIAAIKSNKPRLVVRRSNKYISAQIIEFHTKGDKTITHVNSKVLETLGWKFGKKNIPAAYLTGLLLGKKTKIKEAILDIGDYPSIVKCRLYSVVKGFKDAGINVPCDEKMFPPEERIMGKHINDKVSKNFEEVKKKILAKK